MKRKYFLLITPNRILMMFVIAAVILGLFIADDFGASWDEFARYEKGVIAFSRYLNLNIVPENIDFEFQITQNNGSAFDIIAAFIVGITYTLSNQFELIPTLHFIYYLSFLMGIIVLYFISKRFMGDWAALATVLIFSTQPLLFGHAFINPKDIPFMSIFMIVILTGMIMVESLHKNSNPNDDRNPDAVISKRTLLQAWRIDKSKLKLTAWKKLFPPVFSWVIVSTTLFFSQRIIQAFIFDLLQKAYDANFSTFLGRLFRQFAGNAASVPIGAYQVKAIALANQYVTLFLLVAFLLILARFFLPLFPNTASSLQHAAAKKYSIVTREINRGLPKKIASYLINNKLLLAAILLGISASIRILGTAAGGLVAIYYYFSGARNKTVIPWIAYFSIAALVTFLTWPFLWDDASNRIVGTLGALTQERLNLLLFNGALYSNSDLPWTYFPTLLAFQFTVPALFLSLAGIPIVLVRWRNGTLSASKVMLLFLWFFLPAMIIIAVQPTMYDTIRHSLFIMPPLFILVGCVFDGLLKKIQRPWITFLMFVFVILPGVFSIVVLHPYQYIYFNQFAGGAGGAVQRFELDYWVTSFKAAFRYINDNVEQNANIYISGPTDIATYYSREDISVHHIGALRSIEEFDRVYLLLEWSEAMKSMSSSNITEVFRVTTDNAVIVVVLKYE